MPEDPGQAPPHGEAFVPHLILGVAASASVEEARAAYLEKVRRHPPDREPERFRELHRAIQAYTEPLQVVDPLLKTPEQRPDFAALIEAARKRPPRLPVSVVLALGNEQPEELA